MQLNIQDTFNRELPADPIVENYPRQVAGACFSYTAPTPPRKPALIHVSAAMLHEIGISPTDAEGDDFLHIFSGAKVHPGTTPYAMCYGGHQFGHWAGQLGDGRAINLFEVVQGQQRWALQLKGAGMTPYSRRADGLAVLRSSIREYLCSEAMHHLGVPTTRALSLMLTGDDVERDVLYNGNPALEKGAVVCRVAPSFIRFGNFQILAARQDMDNLRALTDYTIRTFFPELGEPSKDAYLGFFQAVVDSTQVMVLDWERVGFVHGVMNTDNMSILGLTIDYGPYGWLEDYDPGWTPNTTDAGEKRYRYGNQAQIALWNLVQLANALFPLIEDEAAMVAIIKTYQNTYPANHVDMMCRKLGLQPDAQRHVLLVEELEALLYRSEVDMTLFFRKLAGFNTENAAAWLPQLVPCSYATDFGPFEEAWLGWLEQYAEALRTDNIPAAERQAQMNATNPKYVLRNYMAQLVIDAADRGDYALLNEVYHLLLRPYDEQPEGEKWFAKRPDWAREKVGCSMLSCSS